MGSSLVGLGQGSKRRFAFPAKPYLTTPDITHLTRISHIVTLTPHPQVGHTSLLSSFLMADEHWNADCWYVFSDGLADDPQQCLDFIGARIRHGQRTPVIHTVRGENCGSNVPSSAVAFHSRVLCGCLQRLLCLFAWWLGGLGHDGGRVGLGHGIQYRVLVMSGNHAVGGKWCASGWQGDCWVKWGRMQGACHGLMGLA